MTNLDSILKTRDITLLTKVCQSYGFSSGHVWMWELDYKENWALKNWCFWTVVLEDHSCGVESPLDCKEIQPVHPKGNQPWIFIGRTDAEAQTPILWPRDVKNWLIGKDLDGVKGWRWEKGTTGWDGWKASPTQWTWVWASSRSWRWTGSPGMLQSMGLQKVGHNWATELKADEGMCGRGGWAEEWREQIRRKINSIYYRRLWRPIWQVCI